MDSFIDILKGIQSVVWGPITLILLVGTGLYFTIRLGFLQITRLPRAIRYIFEKEEGVEGDDGDVSAFASLCTTLAATIGTGSIVGVATALRTGGPGALFWMWVSAFVGMTTKYAESVLAVKYRTIDENGEIVIRAQFEDARDFNDKGNVFVKDGTQWRLLELLRNNYK